MTKITSDMVTDNGPPPGFTPDPEYIHEDCPEDEADFTDLLNYMHAKGYHIAHIIEKKMNPNDIKWSPSTPKVLVFRKDGVNPQIEYLQEVKQFIRDVMREFREENNVVT